MAVLNIFRKNPIEKMSREKLKERELWWKMKTGELAGEVAEIEAQVQHLFQKSKEAKNRLEEITLAVQIGALALEKDIKAARHAILEKGLSVVSKQRIIKEREADLKDAGVWKSLLKSLSEEVEKYLVEMRIGRHLIEMKIEKYLMTCEERLEYILAVMREVREGKLEPEDAGKLVTKEQEE